MDVEITELEKIDADRVDGVGAPASGIPILLMKSMAPAVKGMRDCPKCDKSYDADHKGNKCENCGADLPDGDATEKSALDIAVKAVTDGKVDEGPDISLGRQIMSLLGQAIGSEAQEISAGSYGESRDVGMLSRAADIVSCWCAREQAVADGKDPDAPCGCCEWCDGVGCGCCPSCGSGSLMCAAAAKADLSTAALNDLPDSAFAYIEPGGSKDSDGKTTPRSKRHFAIHDKAHADNAAARIAQGAKFGDEAKAKVEAAQRKFGEDTSKGQIAPEGDDVDTVVKGSDDLAKVVADAVAKATAPLKERVEALSGELAKVKAQPVPGGPVLSRNVQVKDPRGVTDESAAAKAAYLREKADTLTDPTERAGYLALARKTEEDARKG